MKSPYKAFLLSICAAVLLGPIDTRGQQVGEVGRMVVGQSEHVTSTDKAEINSPTRQVKPVGKGEDLFVQDTLGLGDRLWMELTLNRGGIQGHAILAEAGSYSIESISPDNALLFRLRQGRMSVNLKRGELGVFLKNTLVSILGTEVFLQNNETTSQVYLKKGTIEFVRPGQDSLRVTGTEMAWRWQIDETPQPITGEAMARWKKQMKYDTRTVWSKPFFKRTWVRLGLAAVVGGGLYFAVRGRNDGPGRAQGEVIIDLPN